MWEMDEPRDTAYWLSWEETENSASVASPFGQIESAHAINDGVDDFPAGQEFKDATCASRNVAAAVIGSMKPISTRIPYNNGYGDFFFGRQRLVEKRKYKITDDMSEEEKLEMAGITSSNGVPVVELNGFERSGPFSYEKLPPEIRNRILRLLLRPIFMITSAVERASFSIRDLPEPYEDESDYSGESTQSADEAEQKKKRDEMGYPGRKSCYHLSLFPVRMPRSRGPARDWLFLEWIRKASHVSTNFRLELGQVLWANVAFSAMKGRESCFAVINFLKERPLVHKGIKVFSAYLHALELEAYGLKWWCDYIVRSLDLEKAHLKITNTERDIRRCISGMTSRMDGLKPISTLRVSQSFKVTFDGLASDEDDSDGNETGDSDGESDSNSDGDRDDYEMNTEASSESFNSAIDHLWDMMLPDTLKKSPPETEEEKYLQSRLEDMNKQPSED